MGSERPSDTSAVRAGPLADTLERAPLTERDDGSVQLETKSSASALEVGAVIGEGGMGVVRVALQRSLERVVAIKTAHAGATERQAARMMREAWVTGYLEHPGVVPVHDIVRDASGAPVVVMRRIDGATWEDRIRDARWAEAEGARDLLEQNLRVLVRVCEILEFAHEKDVLHRDIKPDNVMLGRFGEVYLLDWGIALSIGPQTERRLPSAEDEQDIAGTMSYAAPEMLKIVEAPLSAQTDIYQLGAVLFEIVTGRPPHDQSTTAKTLESIAASPPALPPDVAPRLAAVCARAMQREPSRRHASVTALRLEILDCLRSRDAEHLTAEAEARLDELARACESDAPRQRIYDLYGECRFAFREAQRSHRDSAQASRGLTRAATVVLEYELPRDPRVARALLDDAPSVDPELAARVREAARREDEERAGLERLAHDQDPRIGQASRRALLGAAAVAWAASQFLPEPSGTLTHPRYIAGSLIQVPIVALVYFKWGELTRTRFNRQILETIGIALVARAALYGATMLIGVGIPRTRVLEIGMWSLLSACLTVLLDRRLWPMTAALACAFAIAVARPELRSFAGAAGTLSVALNIALVWNRPERRAP